MPRPTQRDYDQIPIGICNRRPERMRGLVDALWDCFCTQGYSWVGFYAAGSATADGATSELILGPCRNSPACSPIGLGGMCGLAYLERRSVLVDDVRRLGDRYIACDPRDLSEIVVPMLESDGSCWGVLDIDSHEPGSFGIADADSLSRLVQAWGLSAPLGDRGRWPILAG